MRLNHLLASWAMVPFALVGAIVAAAPTASAEDKNPIVVVETSMGNITVELEPTKAPLSVANFLKYVDDGFYTNTMFHRVIPGFMVQGGGFDEKYKEKKTRDPIKNESVVHNKNGMSNVRGTIAMARTSNPNSATSQFFINHVDNVRLDTYDEQGYAAFGKVIDGMDVVDKIAKVDTTQKPLMSSDGRNDQSPNVPSSPVVIKSIKRKS